MFIKRQNDMADIIKIPLMKPVGPLRRNQHPDRLEKEPPFIPSIDPSIQLSAVEGLETHLEKLGEWLSVLGE